MNHQRDGSHLSGQGSWLWRHKTVINKIICIFFINKAQKSTKFRKVILYFLFTISMCRNMLVFFTFLANIIKKCSRSTPKMLKLDVKFHAVIAWIRRTGYTRYFAYGTSNLLPFISCQQFCHKNCMFSIICNYWQTTGVMCTPYINYH